MDRKTIAENLGCSEKTVSRYVASGRLPDVRKNGALDISEADVMRLKEQLEAPVISSRDNLRDNTRDTGTGQNSGAIVVVPKSRSTNPSNTLALLDKVTGQSETGQSEARQAKPFVPTSEKLLLSLEETGALTGLSVARLRAAIGNEKLVARKVGKAWKMRRGDVERFVDSIFEDG